MATFIRVASTLVNLDQVTSVHLIGDHVSVRFGPGAGLTFAGDEAAALKRYFSAPLGPDNLVNQLARFIEAAG